MKIDFCWKCSYSSSIAEASCAGNMPVYSAKWYSDILKISIVISLIIA